VLTAADLLCPLVKKAVNLLFADVQDVLTLIVQLHQDVLKWVQEVQLNLNFVYPPQDQELQQALEQVFQGLLVDWVWDCPHSRQQKTSKRVSNVVRGMHVFQVFFAA
tara:strand:+ start:242 stop:562 length:321 start_codon:yes stop_codon:yes gene_type:complete